MALKLKQVGMRLARIKQLFQLSPSSLYYQPRRKEDSGLMAKIKEIAFKHPCYGYRRIWAVLEREGFKVNIKKVYRLYRAARLQRQQKRKRKIKIYATGYIPRPTHPFSVWTMDFFFTRLSSRKRVKVLVVMDEFLRYAFQPLVSFSIGSEEVVEHLEKIGKQEGFPRWTRCDNGPEFRASSFVKISKAKRIKIHYIDPGKPFQNGFSESFIGKFRDECLAGYEYRNLKEAREKICEWFRFYNEERPHSALGYRTPTEFYREWSLSNGV